MPPPGAPDISVVLAAYNERQNVAPLFAALKAVLAPHGSFEVLFADDGSQDGTLDEIRALARTESAVRYLSFTRNFGHQAALRAGLRAARGRAVVLMDCDFEHPPAVIPELIAQWRAGAKVVVTRRSDDAGLGRRKRFTSQMFYRFISSIGDVTIEPGSSDFLLLDRVAADLLNSFTDRDLFLRGAVRWLGYPLAVVPYRQERRTAGVSKFNLGRMIELAVSGITAHSIRPLRFAITLSLGVASFGLLLVFYSIFSFFFIHQTVAGWSSVIASIAILGAAQMLVLGIIGEYVGRILRETQRRPGYIVAETEADLEGRTGGRFGFINDDATSRIAAHVDE